MDGVASPGRLRPQVFSTSRRFDPPRACRPCFMPDPLMGLHPSELCSYRVAVRRLRRRSPLDVGSTRHHLAHRSLVVRVPKHPRNRTSRPPRRTPKRPLGDLLRHSPRGQALEVPGARGARLRRNRNNGGVERSVLLLPWSEDHMGTERSRSVLDLRPEGRNETGSAARRLPRTEALFGTRRRPILQPASSRTEALVSARCRLSPPTTASEDRSPLRRPLKAASLRTPPRTEALIDAFERRNLRRMPPETKASFGPNVRSRWPREHRRLQGFDPRGSPPLTCRLFTPVCGA
jgi:hypothetical protein